MRFSLKWLLVAVAFVGVRLYLASSVQAALVYFTDLESQRIRRFDTLTGELITVVPNGAFPLMLDIDPRLGKMFWTAVGPHQVRSADLNGTNTAILFTSSATEFGPLDLSLDRLRDRLYWSDQTGQILSAELDGSDLRPTGLDGASAIVVDSSQAKVYWSDETLNIQRASLDGTEIEVVVPGFGAADLAIDELAEKLYWIAGRRIFRADLDGSSMETLIDGRFHRNFAAIALDLVEGKVYFTDVLSSMRLGRMNLDGSNAETLITGMQIDPSALRGIAVDPIPEPSTLALGVFAAVVCAIAARARRVMPTRNATEALLDHLFAAAAPPAARPYSNPF